MPREISPAPPGDGIQARGLCRRFSGVDAVQGLDLEIRKGEIYGLVGPDGAGKTTVLRMISGLSRPDSGEVRIGGKRIDHRASGAHAIGYMPQRFGLYADLTIAENIDFHSRLRGLSGHDVRSREEELLAMTRLTPFRDRRAGQLSGGMKQKLALCCSLLHRPAALILDEPTNGVDPVSRRDFWKLLRGLSRGGLSILMATSHLDEAERCYRVGLLVRGRLIEEGAPEDLVARYAGRCFEARGASREALTDALAGVDRSFLVSSVHRDLVFLERSVPPEWLEQQLSRRGMEVRVTPRQPSLEDLFILLEMEDRKGAVR